MKNIWKWALLFLGVFVLTFIIAIPFLGRSGYYGGMPMMAYYGGPGMMGGFGYFGGVIMMFGMLLIPIALVGLLVLGGVALVKGINGQSRPAITFTRSCPHCNRPLQQDWTTCPYCGEKA